MKRNPKDIDSARSSTARRGSCKASGLSQEGVRQNAINRRAFLRGAGTVAIGLPFLEGLPERSAWAAELAAGVQLFIVAACGVVGEQVLPERHRRADDVGPRRR